MAKFDEKLERMQQLMEFRSPINNKTASPVEYHTVGADGNVYGIIKECSKYYIKKGKKGKETLAESYEYVTGFNNKRDYEYKSYNEATKQLELKLMSLNEAYGVKKDVSTVDFNKSKKDFSFLTEEARKELNRMNQILENADKISKENTKSQEMHGSANGDNTTKNNAPFTNATEATLDKDLKAKQTDPKKATGEGYKDGANGVENDLQSDKMKKKNGGPALKGYTKAPVPDSYGDSVAQQYPTGAKTVKMNESVFEDDEDLVGSGDIDKILEAFESTYHGGNFANKNKSIIIGPEDTLDGPNTSNSKKKSIAYGEKHVGGDNGVMNEEESEWILKGTKKSGKGKSIAYGENRVGQLSESMMRRVNALTEAVYNKLVSPKRLVKESLAEKIQRMVNEEVTHLNAWGQHPRYRHQPMQLPPNKEVMRGTADRDFNDDSAKGDKPYGSQIGSSAPFDVNVETITNSVLQSIKESIGEKKFNFDDNDENSEGIEYGYKDPMRRTKPKKSKW